MDRLISEKAVMDAINNLFIDREITFRGYDYLISDVKAIPSAKPTKDLLAQIIRDILAMYVVDENGNQLSRDEVKCGAINIVKKYLRQLPSAEPTLDSIRESIEEYVCNVETDTARAQKMLNAWRAIEYDEPLPSADKWIPVSEPPKELGTYLIQTDGEPYMCQCRWTDVNPFWTDYKTKPHWNIFGLPQYSKVVAWMPLPAPYEPQESEDKKCR